jgi:hypothetical protein
MKIEGVTSGFAGADTDSERTGNAAGADEQLHAAISAAG